MLPLPLHLHQQPPPPPPLPSKPTTTDPPHIFLDSSLCVRAMHSCAASGDLRLGSSIHGGASKTGLSSNPFVSNSLLNFYWRCGRPDDASRLFDHMPERDAVSWTTAMSAHSRIGAADEVVSIFRDMLRESDSPPNEFTLAVLLRAVAHQRWAKAVQTVHARIVKSGAVEDPFVRNCLVDAYAKSACFGSAERVLFGSSRRDVVSWTSVISGCVLHGRFEKALALFARMVEDGVSPNEVTMASLIQSCSLLNEERLCGWIHGWVAKLGLGGDESVASSLVEMYAKNGFIDEAVRIFIRFCLAGECISLDVEAMAALIHCCACSGIRKIGEGLHGYLLKNGFFFSCLVLENSLLDMYGKKEQSIASARRLFCTMRDRDIVSWNTMISCFIKNARIDDALGLLTELHSNGEGGVTPDVVTILSSLQACSHLASLKLGQILHGYAIRSGFECDVFIGNALIDFYAKSGDITSTLRVFEHTPFRDLGSWNSMITAHAIHGDAISALLVFKELKRLPDLHPNSITFLSVLSACARSGMVSEGFNCFKSMIEDHRIVPGTEHFTCMVDLLGKSGHLKAAEDFIDWSTIRHCSEVWGSLLGACGVSGDIEVAERAAKRLNELEPESEAWRVALSNVYARAGKWEWAVKVRAEMKREKLRKEAGWSSVELGGVESYRFIVGDTRHPRSEDVYEVLDGIRRLTMDSSTCIVHDL
ncbi:Pentatricopeptide repeat-containing protein [Acorus gramineus]|uniref:Pentatricopeptide repeat-containing protein n=1 Tax=Acorus gramineus TaxID=55184 RepID=A0AAV9BAD4_ACOGR|nr:Pentatricopeptide repeat-containing protein [Acorus gramineus]